MKTKHRAITKTPGVCGGSACIENTRIPVWLIEAYCRKNMSYEYLLASYPTIDMEDIRNALSYAAHNIEEINSQIRENHEA